VSARLALFVALALAACARTPPPVGQARTPVEFATWNAPFPAFRAVGNVHYVGTSHVAVWLVTTPAGHLLLDSGFEEDVPRLRGRVEGLGFRWQDIKLLLASHAHVDHVQGHALVRQTTGARVLVSRPDAEAIATGGRSGWTHFQHLWPACPVDEVIDDGHRVTLGGTTLVARLTPGHTRGATTWTTEVEEGGRRLAVVFYASGTLPPDAPLAENRRYPQIAEDYRRSFAFWKALPCDVPLGNHGSFFGLVDKHRRLVAGEPANPFVDPDGWQRLVSGHERTFLDAVAAGR
jgi:metallo-beta-lactamase class B